MSRSHALGALQPYLDAVNTSPAPTVIRKGRKFAEAVKEWREQIAVNLKPSTVRAAESHLAQHIEPRLGNFFHQDMTVRNLQAFVTSTAATGVMPKTVENILQTAFSVPAIDSRTKQEQSTKTRNSTGEVPMPAALEKRLRGFTKTEYRENPNHYLFANRNGNPYSVGKVTEYGLWPLKDALGIPHTGTHAFRHAAASELLEEGAPLTVVQRQLRHGDAKTTLQKYEHVVGDSQRRAVNTLAERIERQVIELESAMFREPSKALQGGVPMGNKGESS